jgi:hypothetical protein
LKRKRTVAKFAVYLLPLLGLVSLYQTLFCLWMTSHPLYKSQAWQTLFYVRLSTTATIGILWVIAGTWLLKHKITMPKPSEENRR